jgi:molecular chaperone DnaK (HSP70)
VSAIISIDFGTSTTLVSVRQDESASRLSLARVVPIGWTTPWMPSVFGASDGHIVVGEAALELPPTVLVRSIKSTLLNNPGKVEAVGGVPIIDGIAALIVEAVSRAMQRQPEHFVDPTFRFGCPVLWAGPQRRLLVEAAQRAGQTLGLVGLKEVQVADMLEEPVAAGLSWIKREWLSGLAQLNGHVLVFDSGGGTLDVALIRVHPAKDGKRTITVLAADGSDTAGDALDEKIAADLASSIAALGEANRPLAEALLRDRAREIKEALSTQETVTMPLGGGLGVTLTYDRDRLDANLGPQLEDARRIVLRTLRSGKLREDQTLSPDDIRRLPDKELIAAVTHVLLTGGMAHVPAVCDFLSKMFGCPVTVDASPQTSVVQGIAHADEATSLNLPRPPFNFLVRYKQRDGSDLPVDLQTWAAANTFLYRAFDPLYPSHQLQRDSDGTYRREIPFPPGYSKVLKAEIYCEAPDRARTRIAFELPDKTQLEEIEVVLDRPGNFNLATNGIITVDAKRPCRLRVKDWVAIRGQHHVFATLQAELLPWGHQSNPVIDK